MGLFSWLSRGKGRADYIDARLLKEIKKVREYVERRPHKFREMAAALTAFEKAFDRALRDGRIENKAAVNASIQAARESVKNAEKAVNEMSRKLAEKRRAA